MVVLYVFFLSGKLIEIRPRILFSILKKLVPKNKTKQKRSGKTHFWVWRKITLLYVYTEVVCICPLSS